MEGIDGGLHPAVGGQSKSMEGIDGGLHPAVDGQSLRQWKALMEGYILQWMDKVQSEVK